MVPVPFSDVRGVITSEARLEEMSEAPEAVVVGLTLPRVALSLYRIIYGWRRRTDA